ncbi:ATP-dependent RNA helicase DHX58-like [Glandiceps talaboti]
MASFNYGVVRGGEREHDDQEDPPEIIVLRHLRSRFINAIVASHLLPYLQTCLTRPDEEQIRAEERNKGDIAGAVMLLDFLVKKNNWYEVFLSALKDEDIKLEHLASLLEEELAKDNREHRAAPNDTTSERCVDAANNSDHVQPVSPLSNQPNLSVQSNQDTDSSVDTVDNAVNDLRVQLPDPPPPYTEGTYFEQAGQLVESAGGSPQQNQPLTLNKYFITINAPGTKVQVGGRNLMNCSPKNEDVVDSGHSPKSPEKGSFQRKDEEEADCIIEGEIIEDEEQELMSEFDATAEMSTREQEGEESSSKHVETDQNESEESTPDTKESSKNSNTTTTTTTTAAAAATSATCTTAAATTTTTLQSSPPVESKIIKSFEYEDLKPRSYQYELAAPALEGNNSIICAPTGTGKTHVAMMITKDHMEASLAEQAKELDGKSTSVISKRKAIFLVHRIPLLNQTYKRFKKYLTLFHVTKRSGASMTNTVFESLIPTNDIIITTGGILQNSLLEKKSTLDMFSLIIIDECHHAMKNHPYNVIMAEYLRMKLANPATPLPQIVGLTASPGSGSNSGMIAVTEHILKLCANLDAHVFVTVQDSQNKEALRKVTNDPDKYTSVTRPRNPDPFKEKVDEIMKEIEKKAGLTGIGHQHGTQQYESSIMTAIQEATNQQNHEVAKCCEHLREYNTALQMCNTCRMSDGLDIIDSFYEARKKSGQYKKTEIEKWLYKLYRNNSGDLFDLSEEEDKYPNPKVQELKEKLREEIKGKGNEVRGIIFVKTRKQAKAICECIKEDPTVAMLEPAIVTGVQAKSEDGTGMNQSAQDAALKRFSDGICKLLVSTSVIEEGLDVPECHIVIRYNYATNDISMRQSRGRARAKKSTEHFIGDTELAIKDKVNVFLDQQVEQATEIVQNMPAEQFLKKVQLEQRVVVAQRCMQERKKQLLKSAHGANSVKLLCWGCKQFVCQGSDVYKYDCNHFIKDKEVIESKIDFDEHPKKEMQDQGVMKIYCKNCKQDFGITLPLPLLFPVIKLQSFIVQYNDGKSRRIKKWKDADFQPEIVDELPLPEFTNY